MNKAVSPKMVRLRSPQVVALTFGVLTVVFLAAFYVVAWQEPTQAPPGGNVATPLNVGPTGQSKEGGLILNTGGAANALIIDKGKVGIGIAAPSEILQVIGNIKSSGTISASNYPPGSCAVGSSIRAINANGTVSCEINQLNTVSGTTCPSGWNQVMVYWAPKTCGADYDCGSFGCTTPGKWNIVAPTCQYSGIQRTYYGGPCDTSVGPFTCEASNWDAVMCEKH